MQINPELISEMHQKLEVIHDTLIGNKFQNRKGLIDRMEDSEKANERCKAQVLDMNIKINEIKSKIEKSNKVKIITAISSGVGGVGIGAASTDPSFFKKLIQIFWG